MNTDVIEICSDLTGSKTALEAAEKFISYNEITGKDALHIRLLTEEALSLINGIMDNFKADLQFESENVKDGLLCRIKLTAKKGVSEANEDRIKSISTTGKNENAKGILGKIRELFRVSMMRSADGVYASQGSMVSGWYSMGLSRSGLSSDAYMDEQYWSLMNYRTSVSSEEKNTEEWDELEKSIIAKLADDVKVWLRSESTEVVIEKLVKK